MPSIVKGALSDRAFALAFSAAALLCALLVCAGLLARGDRRERTARYVQQNRAELEAFAAELTADGTYNGWTVSYWPELGMAEFETGASGLGSSTSYWGFYYSPEDVPLPLMGAAEMHYAPSGSGWRPWRKSGSSGTSWPMSRTSGWSFSTFSSGWETCPRVWWLGRCSGFPF